MPGQARHGRSEWCDGGKGPLLPSQPVLAQAAPLGTPLPPGLHARRPRDHRPSRHQRGQPSFQLTARPGTQPCHRVPPATPWGQLDLTYLPAPPHTSLGKAAGGLNPPTWYNQHSPRPTYLPRPTRGPDAASHTYYSPLRTIFLPHILSMAHPGPSPCPTYLPRPTPHLTYLPRPIWGPPLPPHSCHGPSEMLYHHSTHEPRAPSITWLPGQALPKSIIS